ncbi:hypothetical protein IQ07DRAFT_589352 [Pyrenochaeta sp. DS3sAY3a]|nr:hypothetical protein IQ07DRAFT_589352 [Pyrenochaeta sp. DS3sAY3a]
MSRSDMNLFRKVVVSMPSHSDSPALSTLISADSAIAHRPVIASAIARLRSGFGPHCLLTNGLQSRAFLSRKPTTTLCPLIYRSRRLTRCTRQRTLRCRCRHSREHAAYCFTVNVQVAAGGLTQSRWFGFGGRTWPCIGSAIAGRGDWTS